MSLSKRRAPASVSLVFAEPEQGAPLESAAAKLPAHPSLRRRDSASTLRSLMIEDRKDVGSIVEEPDATVEGLQVSEATKSVPNVLVTAQWEGIADQPAPAHSHPAITEVEISPASQIDDPPLELPRILDVPLDVPTLNLPPVEQSSKDAASSSSWFGSFSRSPARNATTKSVSLDSDTPPAKTMDIKPQSQIPHPTELPPPVKESEPELRRSPPQAIPAGAHQQPTRSWFSSPTSSSPLKSTPRPPLSPTSPASPAQSYMSVDEEVPRLNVSTPFNSPHPPSVMQQNAANSHDGKVSMSSLNPSSSRFTLGIPLLGRPKVPLDHVVAAMAAVGEKDKGATMESTGHGSAPKADNSAIPDAKTATEAITDAQATTIAPAESTSSTTASQPNSETIPVTSDEPGDKVDVSSTPTSWWGYVGWSSANSLAPPLDTENAPSSSSQESPTNTIRAVKSAPHLPVQNPPSPSQHPPVESSSKAPIENLSDPEPEIPKAKARSVLSSGTVQSQGSTAWYVPWNWYNNTAVEGVTGPPSTENSLVAESDGKTESELVKEEALARDQIPSIQITPSAVPSPPATESVNPIESGITANKNGWASFFSSTSLLVKSIKDVEKRDENGMEVMDIEDDDDTLASGAVSPA
ncbi:hypothetical protein HWV62_43696, partial [Athelia sp. TMB]